ncbi:hypothetical protein Tco_0008615 [Tanacetum coccineum]
MDSQKRSNVDTNAFVVCCLTGRYSHPLGVGNVIQANMDIRDRQYFDQLLQQGATYRVSKFSCIESKKISAEFESKKYQQNLKHSTSLISESLQTNVITWECLYVHIHYTVN